MGKLSSYKSRFDNTILVVLLDENNEKYEAFAPLFKAHGLAFLYENKYIFVDQAELDRSGYGKQHLIFIESHEIAHFRLQHNNQRGRDVEAEADFVGILMCMKRNFKKSAKLGMSYFKKRNGISFEDYSEKNLSRIKKVTRISKFI
jgi:hypothetical protein